MSCVVSVCIMLVVVCVLIVGFCFWFCFFGEKGVILVFSGGLLLWHKTPINRSTTSKDSVQNENFVVAVV